MFTVSCSFQFSRELGRHKNHGHISHFKSVVGKDRLDFSSFSFSSHEKQLDALSLHLLDSIHKPIHFIPLRYNKFVCRSSLIPDAANAIPILKTALTSLTRLYNSSKGSLFVLQLVPALGVIAFALCCLEPLMRHSRTVFLHQNDNSWKKSNVHYVMTSYIQPLLLWFGASLICRALDPMVLPSEASQAVKQRLLNFVRSLSMVLALAYCLSNFIQQAQKLFGETPDSSDTRSMGFQFAGKAIYSAVWVASVSLFMELLGFSTQKWLTAGGLGTVILTLAGREIFTNFLSSVMIHATRPFVVNEWIQTKIEDYDVSGTVEHVGWWSPTIIRGDDREAVHIPNHKFTVNVVRNLTQKTHWRIKTHLAISHLDVKKINIIVADMRKVLSKNPQVEQQKLHRRVFLENVNPENQALLILVSCFVKTSHFEEYLCVKEAVLLDLLRVISHHRARLATPIRTVQKIYSDADFDNIPFSDTIFSRARAAAMNRSLLLIEPPYKINGDEKSKGPAQTTEEDKEVNPTANPASGSSTDTKTPLRSDSNLDDKITSTPSTSKSDSKLTETPSDSKSEPEPSTSIPDSKTNSKLTGTSASESNPETKISESTTSEKPQVTSGNSKGEGSEKFTSTPPSTTTRPTTLKENIVLGVALDDSRQMLPIEEEMAPSNTAEIKEMAPSINSNESSPSTRTDSKVGQPAEDQEKRDPYI